MIDWVLVRQAAAIEPTNALAAELLLKQAMGCDTEKPGCGGCDSNCCGGNVTLVEKPTTEQAVIYGRNGYTDERDPRQANGRGHVMTNDKVTGIHLTVHVKPERKYRVSNFYLIDELAASGQTVCLVKVYGKDGREKPADVRLATGYNGQDDKFDEYLTAGNARNEFVITNKFWPPSLGPLAVVILNNGQIDSDVAGNIGLPFGHHVSFYVEFIER